MLDEQGGAGGRKQVCRLELVDLFTYEPDFDVTSTLLGDRNSNISYIMEQTRHKVDVSIKGEYKGDDEEYHHEHN